MAALTPTSVTKLGTLGSVNLWQAVFSTADDGDTWASGFPNVVGKWTDDNTNPGTQASVGIASTESSGTFTFYPAEDAVAFSLFVLAQT